MIEPRLPYFKYLLDAMREGYSNNEDVVINSAFCMELVQDVDEQAHLVDINKRLNEECDDLYERVKRLEEDETRLHDDIWDLRQTNKELREENEKFEKDSKKLNTKIAVLESLLDKAKQASRPVYVFAEDSCTATLYN